MSEQAERDAMRAAHDYVDAFNARDGERMADAFNFPHVRLARGRFVTIPDRAAWLAAQTRVSDMLRAEGWHHTVIESLAPVQSGPDKVHLAIEFTRRAADETVIHRFDTLWVATEQDGHWGIQFRSSFLLSDASTLGDTDR